MDVGGEWRMVNCRFLPRNVFPGYREVMVFHQVGHLIVFDGPCSEKVTAL